MRFSLRWLFGLVLLAAVASGSLVYASWPISDALGAALGFFLIGVLIGAVYGRADRAAFCGGCAIAGWAYLVCLWLPKGPIDPSSPFPTLAANRAIGSLHKLVSRELRAEPINGDLEGAYFVNNVPYIRRPMWEPFSTVAHSFIAFLVAIIGGAVGRLFYRTSHRKEP